MKLYYLKYYATFAKPAQVTVDNMHNAVFN